VGVLYGSRAEASWQAQPVDVDFYDLKGVVEKLLEGLLVREVSFSGEGLPAYFRYGATVTAGDETLAGWGNSCPPWGTPGPAWGIAGFPVEFRSPVRPGGTFTVV